MERRRILIIGLFIAGAICLIAALAGVFMLGRWTTHIEDQLTDHQRQLKEHQEAQEELEEILDGKRHPENTVAGLEDLLAVLMRILIEENVQAKSRVYWIERAQEIAKQLREGPRVYPVDAPTGPRSGLVTYRGNGKERRS
jgi:hypothetical protein